MTMRNFAIGIMFLSQCTIGILGNISLLLHYIIIYYNEYTLKPTDLIRIHLIAANFLILLSNGVPYTMITFGMKGVTNDFICKLVLYIQRFGRSMSVGTTCLLSVYQATTINSQKSCCKDLKNMYSNYISLSIFFCWVTYITIHFIFPVILHNKIIQSNMSEKRDFLFCSSSGRDKFVDSLYIALVLFPEVLFSVLIISSSSSMIVFLYRHKQHIEHIRSTSVSLRTSPESRATKNILLLVSAFVAFYTLSSILQGYVVVLYEPSWWLLTITATSSMFFPTLSPFFMSQDFLALRFFLCWINNIKIKNYFTRI